MTQILSTSSTAYEPAIRDYVALLKPGVMSLVVFTGLCGMLIAPGHIHPFLGLVALFSIALGSGASGAVNMWYDRDIDSIMQRTLKRPIPGGRLQPQQALEFGVFLAATSVFLMAVAVNYAAAVLLLGAILFYVFIYTMWLKRSTPQNIVIGGAAGAFPPLIGWVAVTGQLSALPLILFAIIFLWTPPHFWALALYRNEDYRRASVPMMPVVAGSHSTRAQMLIYTLLLVFVTLLPFTLGMTGALYGATAALLGARFIYFAVKLYTFYAERTARQMFKFSILYLFILFAALVADHFVF